MTGDGERGARLFTAMLATSLLLTMVLAGLLVFDLHAGRADPVASSTTTLVGDAAAGAVATTANPGAPLATPGAGGTPAQHPGGGRGGGAAGAGGSGGAGSGSGGSGGGGGPCSGCLAAGAPIPLGSIVTQTGPGRSITLAHAIAAWARDVDRRGGINGHQVNLDLRDDGGNPDTGASEYRSLAQDVKVLALVSECAPITDAQQVGYLSSAGLPDVGECQSVDSAYSSPWVFVAGPTPRQNGELGAKLMVTTQGWPRSGGQVALVCLDEAAVAGTCAGAEAYYGDAALWSGHPQKEEIADSNYPQLIAQWRSDGVRYVHLILEPGNTQRYLAAAADASWSVPTIQGLVIDDSIAAGYPDAEGMFIDTPWTPLDQTGTPGMQRLTTTLQDYYPDDGVDMYAQTGWIGCLVVEHALELMGPDGVSRQRLVDTLNTLRDWDTGLGPVLSYSPSDHVGAVENSLMQLRGAGTPSWRLVGVHGPVGP